MTIIEIAVILVAAAFALLVGFIVPVLIQVRKTVAEEAVVQARWPPDEAAVAVAPSGIPKMIVVGKRGIWKEPAVTIEFVWNVPSMKLSPCAKLISSMIP